MKKKVHYQLIAGLMVLLWVGFFYQTRVEAQERPVDVKEIPAESDMDFLSFQEQEEITPQIWYEKVKAGEASLFEPGLYNFIRTSDYKSFPFEGVKRYYKVHLPKEYSRDRQWPLVLVFHGGGGNADSAAWVSQMNDKADQEGFIVVYPEGTGPYQHRMLTWNAWTCCGPAMERNVNDAKFIRELLFALDRKYMLDPRRIYATGFSNGGMFTYKLACELSDIIAAFAPIAGAMNGDCYPQRPIPLIVFHGMRDERVPYNGGMGSKSLKTRYDSAVSDSVGYFSYHNNCLSTPERRNYGNVIVDSYIGCQNGGDVEVYSIVDQGHAWPGGKKALRMGADEPTTDISATDLMWDFFQRHPFY